MRALTVRQPWAWAIIHGGKNIENRDWAPRVSPGRIAIHAGKAWDDLAADHPAIVRAFTEANPGFDERWASVDRGDFTFGAIIGTVEVTIDSHPVDGTHGCRGSDECQPWGMGSALYHWVLANPRPLAEPIPCRGALGLWTVPTALLAALDAGGSDE